VGAYEDDETDNLYLFLTFVQRNITYLQVTEPSFENQANMIYVLDILVTITNPKNHFMELPDLLRMFYSNETTDIFFKLIINSYDFCHIASAMRYRAYQLIINNLINNITVARKSIKRWLGDPSNKYQLFERFSKISRMFMNTYRQSGSLAMTKEQLESSDYYEISQTLTFFRYLTDKDFYWQEYIEFQPGITSHVIFDIISNLIGT